MPDLFGDLREAIQRVPSDDGSIGELVFALRYLDVMRQGPLSARSGALGHERWRQLTDYARAILSRSGPEGSRASYWDIVSFCLEGAPSLEDRVCGALWGQTSDEATRDARHWLASLAWAMGSGAPRAMLHSTIRSTSYALHASWSCARGVVKITARPSAGFVRDQWIARGDETTSFPGLPNNLYRALFRAARHPNAQRRAAAPADPSRFTLGAALAAHLEPEA